MPGIEQPITSQHASVGLNDNDNVQQPSSKTTYLKRRAAIRRKPIKYITDNASDKISNLHNRKTQNKKMQDMKISQPKDKTITPLEQKSLNAKEQQTLLQDAETAALPYHQDISRINNIDTTNGTWQVAQDISTEIQNTIQQDTTSNLFKKAKFDVANGRIIDKKTGLTAYIIENPEAKEVRVIFGGTSSGKYAGGLMKRQMKNPKSVLKQWGANIKNIINSKEVPDSYQQASELLKAVNKVVNNKDNYSLMVLGHSKGAAEATFATLTQNKPSPAICFSSAELGTASLERIPEENLAQADSLINNYYVEGDMIPDVGKKFGFLSKKIKNLAKLGNYYKLPSASKYNTPIDRHDKFVKHVRAFLK